MLSGIRLPKRADVKRSLLLIKLAIAETRVDRYYCTWAADEAPPLIEIESKLGGRIKEDRICGRKSGEKAVTLLYL